MDDTTQAALFTMAAWSLGILLLLSAACGFYRLTYAEASRRFDFALGWLAFGAVLHALTGWRGAAWWAVGVVVFVLGIAAYVKVRPAPAPAAAPAPRSKART